MMQTILKRLQESFTLKELNVGEFTKLKVNGMNFTIKQYEAIGLGNVSVMQASGFFGLMKMDTLIINPTKKDLPLISYDRIYAMGNDTLIIELYDTLVQDCNLSGLQNLKEAQETAAYDHDLGSHWYDSIKLKESLARKGKKKQTLCFNQLTEAYLKAYIACGKHAMTCEETIKKEKASVYVEGLLTNGGPSTDIFKKHLGEVKTGILFRKILFGTE